MKLISIITTTARTLNTVCTLNKLSPILKLNRRFYWLNPHTRCTEFCSNLYYRNVHNRRPLVLTLEMPKILRTYSCNIHSHFRMNCLAQTRSLSIPSMVRWIHFSSRKTASPFEFMTFNSWDPFYLRMWSAVPRQNILCHLSKGNFEMLVCSDLHNTNAANDLMQMDGFYVCLHKQCLGR